MVKKIAFITYETQYAPSGGISAVMARLPQQVSIASGFSSIVLTPLHYKIPKTAAIINQLEQVGTLKVPFDGKKKTVLIQRMDNDQNHYFLQPKDKRIFAGSLHPYDVGPRQEDKLPVLLRDALFFGVAAVQALPVISPQTTWILMMQDWEAATAVLALTGVEPANEFKAFLTLHNSYDNHVGDEDLLRFAIDPAICPGETVLERTIPLVNKPVFTVSETFASDFKEEILQTEIMAPHLKALLSTNLVGVNNGLFIDLGVPKDLLLATKGGGFSRLEKWKSENRQEALTALQTIQPDKDKPLWGNLRKFKLDNVPWFVLAGRDDPRQKGFDVACLAIRKFLEKGGDARFLFLPIPGDEGLAGLDFLRNLALNFPHQVIVLPFIFREGYFATLRGAAYGVMPSFYEPFGMANEFYLMGTVGIGRATGGILQQIVPYRAASAFSPAVQIRSNKLYGSSAHPTGILYREPDEIPTVIEDWQGINAAGYDKSGKKPDRVKQRASFGLFREMAEELCIAIEDGVKVYLEKPELYYNMLAEGITYLQNNFSWERTSQTYARYIK
jgi:glycogen synthase